MEKTKHAVSWTPLYFDSLYGGRQSMSSRFSAIDILAQSSHEILNQKLRTANNLNR